MRHIISAIVENRPGVLARIIAVISGRGYNIETLNVGPAQETDVSRLTMTVAGDEHVLEQVSKQLNKMVDVIKVTDLTGTRHHDCELLVVEVAAPRGARRTEIIELATIAKAQVVGVSETSLTLQFVGRQDEISELLQLLRPYKVLDLDRSGTIAVARPVSEG